MEIVKLNKQKLSDFIHSDEYKSMPDVPISYHRAISHLNNPRLEDDDILLILIYENVLIGYLGIIPDLIFINDIPQKMAWMSCIWTHASARGKGIAKLLTSTAIESYNNKIFCTEFTPEAEMLYNKLNKFDSLVNKTGVRIYRRSCLHITIPARYPKTSFLFPLFLFHDVFINLFHDLFLKKTNKYSNNYTTEILQRPDESCFRIAEKFNNNNLSRRSGNEIEWFFNFPWIKETNNKTKDSKRYYFSSEARKFKILTVKVNLYSDLVAFMVVTIREEHLKTPYIFVNLGHEEIVVETLNNLMHDHKIEILTTYQEVIKKHFKEQISFLNSKIITRKYLQSKEFNLTVTEVMLQDGDGDCGFV